MKKKILFVDDEPNVLDGIKRFLRSMRREWSMSFAGSGAEAMKKMEQESYDAIVSDMRMPGMDGVALLTEVMNKYPQMVRMILSGQSNQDAAKASVLPAHQFLSKPCDPEIFKATITRALTLGNLIANGKIRQLVARIGTLPALPDTYVELTNELQSETSTAASVGQIVAKDVGVSADILKTVNSSFFGVARHISNIEEAVAYLGLDLIKGLVLSSELMGAFDDKALSFFPVSDLWRHSLAVAGLARRLAGDFGFDRKKNDGVFIAGMLHDIGKLILAQEMTQEYETVIRSSREENKPLHQAELEVLGAGHAEVGAYLMGLWGLSETVVEAIAYHHQPGLAATPEPTVLTLIHAADGIERELTQGQSKSFTPILDQDYLASVKCSGALDGWRKVAAEMIEQGAQDE